MTNIKDIINEYIENSYLFERWLDEKHNVQLVKSKIDGSIYVCKFKEHYDINIYNRLKEIHIDGIPEIYELMETEHGLIIIEEYVDGISLDSILLSNENTEGRICDIAISVCKILKQIHMMNPPIIHRDIKPQNIMLSGDMVYLLDFNIAKEYSGGKSKDTFIMGTRDFAAPEQYGFSESDERTDIYGLGATIKYLMENANVVSEKLKRITKKAMEIDADNRYQNVDEMIQALSSDGRKNPVSTFKKYLLPGFRRGNIFFMLIAATFYVFWGWMCFTVEMTPNKYDGIVAQLYNWTGRLLAISLTCFVVAFTFNYLGFQDKILNKFSIPKSNRIIRALTILVIDVLFSIFIFGFYVVVSYFFFNSL